MTSLVLPLPSAWSTFSDTMRASGATPPKLPPCSSPAMRSTMCVPWPNWSSRPVPVKSLL